MKVKIYYVEVTPELESTEFDLASVIKAKGECIVGRSPECDLVLEGADLSRQHGRFWINDEYYYFADLGSSNGTLFNGELAQPKQDYLLSLGDTIRMGDFVLKMEPEEELAATVFKVFDPALFKSRQQQVANIIPEPDSASPAPVVEIAGLTAAAIVAPIIIDRSSESDDRFTPEETPAPIPATENIPTAISAEPPTFALDEWGEDEDDTPDVAVAAPPIATIIVDAQSEDDTPDVAVVAPPIATIFADDDEIEDDTPAAPPIYTIEDQNDTPNLALEALPISTIVADANEEGDDDMSDVAVAEPPISITSVVNEDEDDTSDLAVAESPISAIVTDIHQDEDEDDTSDLAVAESPISAIVTDIHQDEDEDEDDTPDLAVAESPISVIVTDIHQDEDEDEDDTPDLVAPLALTLETEEEEEQEITTNILVEEDLGLTDDRDETADLSPSNLVVEEDLDPENDLEVETTPDSLLDEPAVAVIAESNATNKKFGVELLNQKQIVLIAHDSKVADLTDLVNQHKDFLSQCLTISWQSIADSLRQETGMVVSKELPSGVSGGFQTIAGLVNSGDVLAVIFLKDFFAPSSTQANEEALLRLCNINEIMLATNIATAESIVHYLQS